MKIRSLNVLATFLATSGILHAQDSAQTQMPETIVFGQKQPAVAQELPLSITAIDRLTLERANVQTVRDAAIYAPNVFMTEFTARFLSNPRFRGVGSSPNNPGITTYLDGVPQLNANSSSVELLDVNQVEFIRGPQGALFGRNTIGGLIYVTSRRPSFAWTGEADFSYGNYDYRDVRATVSGPAYKDIAAVSLAAGYSSRDGYTENDLTGNDIDSREAVFSKAQLLLRSSEELQVRLILSAEHAEDGDFALGNVTDLRRRPHHVSRDFEGEINRDILAPTLLADYFTPSVKVSSISGFVWWQTEAQTDLDYSPLPLLVRDNDERQHQFTQEIRISSTEESPLQIGENLTMAWQSGVFLFKQDYQQDAGTTLSPLVTGAPFAVEDLSLANLEDTGVGIYGQATFTFLENWDLTAGLRFDHESKEADLTTGTVPGPAPLARLSLEDDFSEVSPHAAVAWRPIEGHMAYLQAARGYKAGGFNPVSPEGFESYGQETSWSYELGYKSTWMSGRLQANVALFYIDWSDLQLNVPVLEVPGRFYVDNVGSAISRGVEFESRWRAVEWLDVFGSAGYTDSQFLAGSVESGQTVGGNPLPYTPEFTLNVGAQGNWAATRQIRLYARAEVTAYGDFRYTANASEGQDAYSIANFRAGVGGKNWVLEGWVNNAFDTAYVPLALPFGLTPETAYFLGESGAPLTFGARVRLSF